MKLNLQRFFLLFAFLLLDFVAFAQPGTGSGSGTDNDLENEDLPAAPINAKLIWLAIAGIIFAYYTIKKSRSIRACK